MFHPILESWDQMQFERKWAGGLRIAWEPQKWPQIRSAKFIGATCTYFILHFHATYSCYIFRCVSISRTRCVNDPSLLKKISIFKGIWNIKIYLLWLFILHFHHIFILHFHSTFLHSIQFHSIWSTLTIKHLMY